MDLSAFKKDFDSIRKSGKFIVGLTGQVGCGKSSALEYFRRRGFFCVDSDNLAKEVLTFKECCSKLIKRFGCFLLKKDGSIDRHALAEKVFFNESALKWLERLLHPAITKEIIRLLKESDEKVAIIDVPLLFESRFDLFCDLTVCVCAAKKVRVKRLLRKGWQRTDICRRTNAQYTMERKAEKSDIVVFNNGSLENLYSQIEVICKILEQ